MNEAVFSLQAGESPPPGAKPPPVSRRASVSRRLLVQGFCALGRYGARHPLGLVGIVLLLALAAGGVYLAGREVSSLYHLRAARDCLNCYHNAEAQRHLQVCLAIRPKDPDVLLLVARAARRSGALDAAEKFLERYEEVRGADDDLTLERMLLQAERGELEPVRRCFRAQVEQQHPDTALILEAVTRGNLRALRLRDAEDCLRRWREVQPDNVQALLLQGNLGELRQARGEAAAAYRKAVEIDPYYDEARLRLAGTLIDLGRGGEALPHLEYLRPRLPDNPEVAVGLARSLDLLARQAEAVEVLDDLLGRQPNHAAALAVRGRLALQAGRLEEAEGLLRRAVALDPGTYSTRYQFYTCLSKRGNEAEAREESERLKILEEDTRAMEQIVNVRLAKTPNDPALYHQVATIALRAGQVDEAVRWLQSALRVDPNFAPAHQMLAGYYHRSGNPGLAAQHREKARAAREAPATPAGSPGR
jgi:predicted Zn-dependent protease